MADINQVVTLGIGVPAGIPEFLTFGLQTVEPVNGKGCWTAGQSYTNSFVEGQEYLSGYQESDTYLGGFQAGQETC